MGFTGAGNFKIKNATGGEIQNVRVTHFMKGSDYIKDSELAIITKLANGASSEYFTFHSIGGKNDHWCVAFQNSKGCWQSYDLDKSMNGDYVSDGYQLIIEADKFTFSATKKKGGTVTGNKKIKGVYDVIKS